MLINYVSLKILKVSLGAMVLLNMNCASLLVES